MDEKRGAAREDRLLKGWRQIADHFGRDQSTVRRWAAEKQLPVYRAGAEGGRGVPVHAYASELDAWLTLGRSAEPAEEKGEPGRKTDPAESPAAPAAVHRRQSARRASRWLAPALAGTALLGLVAVYVPGSDGDRTASRTPNALPENVHALYSRASYLWPKRTRETLLEAERLLKQVADLAPGFADAEAALATVYNLMVEYHVKPAEEGYGLSLAAAQRAIEIDPQQASALTVLGDLSYYWERNYEEAFGYFGRAVDADPENAQARQWYASALMTSGRLREAEAQIRKARDLKPESRSIIVSQAMIQLGRGDSQGARRTLLELLRNESNYRNPYRFLLFAALKEQDMPAYIATLHDWFELIGSPSGKVVADAAEAGWRAGGEAPMIEAMADAARRDDIRGSLEQYFRAHVLALAGDWQGALDQLERTPTRQAFYYSIDPAFDAARRDSDFLREIGELGFPVIPSSGA